MDVVGLNWPFLLVLITAATAVTVLIAAAITLLLGGPKRG